MNNFFSREKSAVKMIVYVQRPYMKDLPCTHYSALGEDAKDRRNPGSNYFAIERLKRVYLNNPKYYRNTWRTAIFYNNATGAEISRISNTSGAQLPIPKERKINL